MIVVPERTIAIVVGIEEYAAGAHWRLDGPVPDACRFTGWLLSCGVPPANITLLTAPLDDNKHWVEEQRAEGVDIVDARANTIRNRLITELPGQCSDLLLIHWGGHGVVDDRNERRLIYNDAAANDRRNMNITGLLALLRTSPYRGHPHQRIVIDSCLTFARTVGWQTGLPDERFQHNDPLLAVDQLTLFAASDGERAKNDNVLQTGLFSQTVLDSLSEVPGEWPPDFTKVRHDVDSKFQELRADRRTRQVPSHIWFRRGSDDETLIFTTEFSSPRADAGALGMALLEPGEYNELRKILRVGAPPDLRGLYREATRSVELSPPQNLDDVRSIVDTLRKPINPRPLFEFLVRFAAATDDEATNDELWKWINDVGPRYLDVDQLRDLDGQLRRTFLLVKLEPDLIDSGHRTTVWQYIGDDGKQVVTSPEAWQLRDVADALSDLLVDFDPVGTVDPPVVEFMVPTEMMDETVENLPVRLTHDEAPLGAACPVVVRPLERFENTVWCAAHAAVWPKVASYHAYDEQAIHWIEQEPGNTAFDPSNLHGQVCAALAYTYQGPSRKEVLHYLFEAGVPIALWHRAGRLTGRDLLHQVLRGQPLLELPDVVHGQRYSCRRTARTDHPGRDLVLLWDDPTRVPDRPDWHVPAVVEGVAP
ncbi:caspase family protein [Amycolatopsis keratiniphila]|uniref:Caspase domain-containing protein n=1 Tax=Amycolatopsis keratiniphila TaxID=129921 RepID=R4SX83_9PSEU|nr:caspase family protein [Amycolatopsis keratiniphila]AGM07150.1 hypothetical protein AORI_4566 [Amycolatopsis keratiniphila]